MFQDKRKYDIDGSTLKMMNNVERISQIIPKFKQQLLFLEKREKLFQTPNEQLVSVNSSSNHTSIIIPITQVPVNDSSSSNVIAKPTINVNSKVSTDDSIVDEYDSDSTGVNVSFPIVYTIPSLPSAQILIDVIAHDLIDNFDLLYPSKKQFNRIGKSIVEFLKLPMTHDNVATWKDALQTKLKRKRPEHVDNLAVQHNRMKYARSNSGRPVKRKIGETAERDRYKQILIAPNDDEAFDNIESKLEQLRNPHSTDIDYQLNLWRVTLHARRQSVRDLSTKDILHQFPGYGNVSLVFEEVKWLVNIDLSDQVRRRIPVISERICDEPIFITDSPPIRLLKILCRKFDETIQYYFCNNEPITPYPTLVCIDDRLHVFVDFNPVVSTSSPDDALALLIGMYTIFELSFDQKSRSIRLLYSLLHGDTQFLSNSLRLFIREKNIDIRRDTNTTKSILITRQANHSLITIGSRTKSQSEMNKLAAADDKQIDRNEDISIRKNSGGSTHDSQLNSDISGDTVEYNSSVETTTSVPTKSSQKKKQRRKRNSNETDQCETFPKDIQQDNIPASSRHCLPLNDCTNTTTIRRDVKRKRRV